MSNRSNCPLHDNTRHCPLIKSPWRRQADQSRSRHYRQPISPQLNAQSFESGWTDSQTRSHIHHNEEQRYILLSRPCTASSLIDMVTFASEPSTPMSQSQSLSKSRTCSRSSCAYQKQLAGLSKPASLFSHLIDLQLSPCWLFCSLERLLRQTEELSASHIAPPEARMSKPCPA